MESDRYRMIFVTDQELDQLWNAIEVYYELSPTGYQGVPQEKSLVFVETVGDSFSHEYGELEIDHHVSSNPPRLAYNVLPFGSEYQSNTTIQLPLLASIRVLTRQPSF